MKIGVDIADTIIDVWPLLIEEAEKFNLLYSNNKRSDDKHLYLPEDIYNWNDDLKSMFWNELGQDITFLSPVKKDVKETLLYYKKLGYLIYFITAKTNTMYTNLENNIIKLLISNDIPFDEIYTQISNKGKFCFEHKIDYLIDDSFTNCLSAHSYGITSILVSNVYNSDRVLKDNMYRINEFSEVKRYIKGK